MAQALENKQYVPSFITVHEQQVSIWGNLSILMLSSTLTTQGTPDILHRSQW